MRFLAFWTAAGLFLLAPRPTLAAGASLDYRCPVILDSTTVYWSTGADSGAAHAEADRVRQALIETRDRLIDPQRLRLWEEQGAGMLALDTTLVVRVRPENRADTLSSALANALALREMLVAPQRRPDFGREEVLLLRLFLGIVFPFLLLVVLRMTRLGLRRWERQWRPPVRRWLARLAERRGHGGSEARLRRVVNFLTALERLTVFSIIVLVVSFIWFALFPDTRALAYTLVARILGPAFELLGETARGLILLIYSAVVLLVAGWLNRHLARRRRIHGPVDPLSDPAIHIPLRIAIWLTALFLVLFPYPGAPRFFAVGVLLVTILSGLVALRPVTEEIACGIYLNIVHTIRAGDVVRIDGRSYEVRDLGLAQVLVSHEEGDLWIPYSRILKSEVSITYAR